MLHCNCEITISKSTGLKTVFNFVHSIEIESSYKEFTDTCKIVLPRKITFDKKELFVGENAIFKRGDKIQVKIGYKPNLELVFDGYIRNVGANVPVMLECEDSMYLLKQYKITYPENGNGNEKAKISDLLKYILKDVNFNLLDNDLGLGNIKFTKVTPVRVLEELKNTFGLYSYFKDGVLQVGFGNNTSSTKEAEFKMEKVIINSNSLEWQNEADVFVGVTAINIDSKNNKIEAFAGDIDGDQKTYHFSGLNETQLKEQANKVVKEFKYTGYKGELETFGEPIMHHGERAKIVSTKLPERNGVYLIRKVRREYSVDGGNHQFLTLGEKVQ